jgi:hypothetical protein
MAFTDHCDVFASFHEQGFNRIVEHLMRQRPSLFNYATRQIAADLELLCCVIKPHPIVHLRQNPLLTIEDPLPIPGSPYGVNFAAQICALQVDFHPGNVFGLPPELHPPLGDQRLALHVKVCAGIGCPPRELVDRLIPPPSQREHGSKETSATGPPIPLPTRGLDCFCLDAFAVGGVRIRHYDGKPWLEPFLDDLEIVDIQPAGLENSLECYIELLLRLVVLPKMRFLLEVAPLEILKDLVSAVVTPATSPALANNPAIEQDQLKAFIDVEVI